MTWSHAGLYSDEMRTVNGRPAALTAVTVKNADSGTNATLYADRNRSGSLANPVTTDAAGNLAFYAEPGRYTCTANSYTFSIEVSPDPDDLTGNATAQTTLFAVGASSGTYSITNKVTGDTAERYAVSAGGTIELGSGSTSRDVNLYRSAANTLKTDDSLSVAGNLSVSGIGQRLFVRKTADQSVTSSTTLIADTQLALTPTINAVYIMRLMLFYTASTSSGINVAWSSPIGSSMVWGGTGNVSAAPTISSADAWVPTSTTLKGVEEIGLLVMSSTAAALTLFWAQSTSNATATVLKAGSFLSLERVA